LAGDHVKAFVATHGGDADVERRGGHMKRCIVFEQVALERQFESDAVRAPVRVESAP
jgi:hypothetical protein